MGRFTKRPITIDAVQFTGENLFECLRFMGESQDVIDNLELKCSDAPIIHTPEGTMTTSRGDWIIRGVKGEYYPCKPDIFAATYDVAEGDTAKAGRLFAEAWNEKVRKETRVDVVDQPPPTPQGDKRAIWELVVEDFKYRNALAAGECMVVVVDAVGDMVSRDKLGRERYGTPLTAHNGRDQLIDAYQEQLDAAVYMRAAMEEGILVPRITYNGTLDAIMELRGLINERASRST